MLLLRNRAGTRSSISFSSLDFFGELGRQQKDSAGWLALSLLSLFIIFASISLARPQKSHDYSERKASGIDIVIAMDVSYSMEIDDFILDGYRVQRSEISRNVVKAFIANRPNDRIGIIPFAGRPYQESPITLEHEWLLTKVDDIKPNRHLSQGTAIGSAISASAIRLDKREDSKSRIIILLTDGSNNSGRISPLQAAEAAKTLGIKIYTVAIGTETGRLQSQRHPGQEFDTETLQQIAEITEAEYYRAMSTNDLVAAFTSIDQLEKTERTKTVITTYEDHHHYFTLMAVISLIAYLLHQIFRRHPGPA